MRVFVCLLRSPSSSWFGTRINIFFFLAFTSFLSHLCILSTSHPLKESSQREERKWRRAEAPCRREVGWLMIHPCYTVGCQCKNGLGPTFIQSKLQREGSGSLQLLMLCSCTRLVSAQSWWQMTTKSQDACLLLPALADMELILYITSLCFDLSLSLSRITHNAAGTCLPFCEMSSSFWRLWQVKASFSPDWRPL